MRSRQDLQLLKPDAGADILGVSVDQLKALILQGHLNAFMFGGNTLRVAQSEVLALVFKGVPEIDDATSDDWRAFMRKGREERREQERAERADWEKNRVAEEIRAHDGSITNVEEDWVVSWRQGKKVHQFRFARRSDAENALKVLADQKFFHDARKILEAVPDRRALIQCIYCGKEFRSKISFKTRCSECPSTAREDAMRKARLKGKHSAAEWRNKLIEYGHSCAYCGEQSERLTKDHVLAITNGGSDAISNLVPACARCNTRKSNDLGWKPMRPKKRTSGRRA